MIKSTRDALNNFTTYEYYPSTTNLKEVTYPEGNSVEYTYDARDNVTGTIAHPKTGSGTISTSATYSSTCRSEEHTSELQSLMRTSYAVFCLTNKKQTHTQ